MNLLEKTKELCRLYDIKPARSRGQNFLIQEDVYDRMAEQADLQPDDVVLEVGPGLGFLTARLAVRAKKVVAVEIDKKLVEVLKIGLVAKGIKNVEVINENVLEIKIQPPLFPPYHGGGYKIAANLPYNITSIFLRKFLSEIESKPELMVLMLQKEVAERICAQAGKMSLLSVSVQFYAKPELVAIVAKENFWPKPEVDSAIVKIITNPPNPLNPPDPLYQGGAAQGGKFEREFFQLVKFGFSAKRKMLKNNLAVGFRLETAEAAARIKQAGFNPKVRAQELSVNDWLKLLPFFVESMV
ncbi:MAG: 16S rRNA (adenine(1518)-N(6)/adenine(1519)-N(6))-dimethyltransferase RsmA [bacterium]|nr:16S rRNA (adenine(1518)-N(6)/adenine(1519)-N(6))-dimethyltransferase RsmA [bacterium]